MAPARARWSVPLTLLVVTAAVYLPTLYFEFVYDDVQQIVMDQPRLQWHALPGYFMSDVWSPISFIRTNYYRPVFLIWLLLNSQLFGLNPMLWHASAIACHLAATLLFYFLARRLVGDPLLAGCAALLFGVHPVHVEAVAWVSGATEPLFAVFAFATLLSHLRAGRLGRTAAPLLFALALFAKETAVVLPLLIGAYEWLFPAAPPQSAKARLHRAAAATVPYVVVTVVYLLARVLALGNLAPVGNRWPAGTILRTLPFAVWFYLRQLALPLQYSLFHPRAPVSDFGLTDFVLPLTVVAMAAAGLFWISKRSGMAAFAALLWVVPLLPVLNLVAFGQHDYVHDRYLYAPSAGFCLLAALGLKRLFWSRLPLQAGAVVAVTGLLAFVTISTSRYWKDEISLFSRAAEVSPESPIALMYLGKTLLHAKRYQEALAPLKKASFLDLENSELPHLLAGCYYGLGQLDEAASYLQDAIRLKPKFPDSYLNLAMIEARRGRLAEAEAHLRQALRLRPGPSPLFDRYHFRLGEVLEQQGNRKGALAEYEAELAENPDAEDVRDRLLALKTRLSPF